MSTRNILCGDLELCFYMLASPIYAMATTREQSACGEVEGMSTRDILCGDLELCFYMLASPIYAMATTREGINVVVM